MNSVLWLLMMSHRNRFCGSIFKLLFWPEGGTFSGIEIENVVICNTPIRWCRFSVTSYKRHKEEYLNVAQRRMIELCALLNGIGKALSLSCSRS